MPASPTEVGIAGTLSTHRTSSRKLSSSGDRGMRSFRLTLVFMVVILCTACGEFHADTNAAWNIAGGGAVVNRPVSGADVSSMGHPKAACFSWQ